MIVGGITGGLVVLLLSVVLTATRGGESIGSIYNNVRQQFDAGIDVTGSGDIMIDGVTAIDASRAATLLEKTEVITADNTITAAESGKVFYLSGAASTSTLPAPASGLEYTFVVDGSMSADIVINSATADSLEGSIDVNSTSTAVNAADRVVISSSVEDLGDTYIFRSNGSDWFVEGSCHGAACASSDG